MLKNANMQSVSQQQLKAMFPSANRIQTVFLKPNTNLLSIPPRGSPHCSFKRCIAIPRQEFTDDTIATLDSGDTESTYLFTSHIPNDYSMFQETGNSKALF